MFSVAGAVSDGASAVADTCPNALLQFAIIHDLIKCFSFDHETILSTR